MLPSMANGIDFTLVMAPDEKPMDELRQLQAQGRILQKAVKEAERQQSENGAINLRAAGDHEFLSHIGALLSVAAQKAAPPLAAALATWIGTRAGRKVKIKVGEVEIEAGSAKEVKDLLDQAQEFKRANEPKRIHER